MGKRETRPLNSLTQGQTVSLGKRETRSLNSLTQGQTVSLAYREPGLGPRLEENKAKPNSTSVAKLLVEQPFKTCKSKYMHMFCACSD